MFTSRHEIWWKHQNSIIYKCSICSTYRNINGIAKKLCSLLWPVTGGSQSRFDILSMVRYHYLSLRDGYKTQTNLHFFWVFISRFVHRWPGLGKRQSRWQADLVLVWNGFPWPKCVNYWKSTATNRWLPHPPFPRPNPRRGWGLGDRILIWKMGQAQSKCAQVKRRSPDGRAQTESNVSTIAIFSIKWGRPSRVILTACWCRWSCRIWS